MSLEDPKKDIFTKIPVFFLIQYTFSIRKCKLSEKVIKKQTKHVYTYKIRTTYCTFLGRFRRSHVLEILKAISDPNFIKNVRAVFYKKIKATFGQK